MNKIHIYRPSKTTAISTFWESGSVYEPDTIKGVSHFIEHLLFKKTLNGQPLSYYIEKVGGNINGFTNTEITEFHVQLPSRYFKSYCRYYYDIINYLNISETDFNLEKKVILQEIKEYKDNIDDFNLMYMFDPLLFLKGDGRRLSVLGTEQTIKNMSLSVIRQWYNKYFVDDNRTEIIVGNIKSCEQIQFVGSRSVKPFISKYRLVKGLCGVRKLLKQVSAVHCILGGVSSLTSLSYLDCFLLSLYINSYLDGMGGALFNNIREKHGFVYHIDYKDYYYSNKELVWHVETSCPKKNLEKVYAIICQTLKSMSSLTDEELDYVCEKSIGKMDVSLDDSLSLCLFFSNIYDLDNWKEYVYNYKKHIRNFKRKFRDYVKLIDFDRIVMSYIEPY